MRTKRKLLILSSIMILTFTACGQNKLVNRWTAAGHLRHGKLVPENNKDREYEFLKNGTFKLYANGTIEGSGTYVMASDAKSVLLKDGNQSGSLKIMKLTSTELVMIFNPGRDTIVFYPSGSASAKQSQAKAISYQELQKLWLRLTTNYQRQNDLMNNLVMIAQSTTDANNEIFKRLAVTRKELGSLDLDLKNISDERFGGYQSLQAKYTKELNELFEFMNKYPKSKETQSYDDGLTQLFVAESRADKSKIEFVVAFNKYHGKEILNIK